MSKLLYAVILSGGSVTRFWPFRRGLYPKRLLRILGNHTLSCVSTSRTFIVTNRSQADVLTLQLRKWKRDIQENITAPMPRISNPDFPTNLTAEGRKTCDGFS